MTTLSPFFPCSATFPQSTSTSHRKEIGMGVNAPLNRKLRMGLVGGGQGAFIGRVHATAALMDNLAELVAGALSSDPAKAKASAPDYDITPDRAYGSFKEMADSEAKRPD